MLLHDLFVNPKRALMNAEERKRKYAKQWKCAQKRAKMGQRSKQISFSPNRLKRKHSPTHKQHSLAWILRFLVLKHSFAHESLNPEPSFSAAREGPDWSITILDWNFHFRIENLIFHIASRDWSSCQSLGPLALYLSWGVRSWQAPPQGYRQGLQMRAPTSAYALLAWKSVSQVVSTKGAGEEKRANREHLEIKATSLNFLERKQFSVKRLIRLTFWDTLWE